MSLKFFNQHFLSAPLQIPSKLRLDVNICTENVIRAVRLSNKLMESKKLCTEF